MQEQVVETLNSILTTNMVKYREGEKVSSYDKRKEISTMNKHFIPVQKRSKKKQKEYYKRKRVENGFNTGIRDMQTKKKPSRTKSAQQVRKLIRESE